MTNRQYRYDIGHGWSQWFELPSGAQAVSIANLARKHPNIYEIRTVPPDDTPGPYEVRRINRYSGKWCEWVRLPANRGDLQQLRDQAAKSDLTWEIRLYQPPLPRGNSEYVATITAVQLQQAIVTAGIAVTPGELERLKQLLGL